MRAKYIENLQSAAQAALYVNVLAAGASAFAFEGINSVSHSINQAPWYHAQCQDLNDVCYTATRAAYDTSVASTTKAKDGGDEVGAMLSNQKGPPLKPIE